MMKPLYEQLDLTATRKAARQHLKTLGKKVIHQEIMEYITYTSSVISGTGEHGGNTNKALNAMERKKEDNQSVDTYVKKVINCLNQLELDQRNALLAKYLYRFDNEEMETFMDKSISTIKKNVREAEVDFAILIHCEKFKITIQK